MPFNTKEIFGNRGFQRYLAMRLSSGSAYAVASLVIVWYVYSVTGSPIDVAIVGVTETVSALILSLPAGVWVDRYNRIKLLSISNAVRGLCVTLLIVVTLYYGFQLIAIVVLVFIMGAFAELYRSSNLASLPELVERERLADSNGVVETGTNLLGSLSNAIGGLMFPIGVAIALSYGAVGFLLAFLFSIALLGFGRKEPDSKSQQTEREKRGLSAIREGFAWLFSQRGLFWLTVSSLPFNFFFTMTFYFLVVYVKTGLGTGSIVYGAVLAANVVGYSIGVLLVGRTRWALRMAGKVWVLIYGAGIGAALLLMGLFPNSYLAAVFYFAAGLALGFGGNVWLTSAQNIVPVGLRGRYFAVDGLISFIGGPPAIAAGGVAVLLYGVIHVYLLAGIIMLIFAALFSAARSLWKLDGTAASDPTT